MSSPKTAVKSARRSATAAKLKAVATRTVAPKPKTPQTGLSADAIKLAAQIEQAFKKSDDAISEDAMRRLIAYDWPGNVRELENAIERAVALGSGPIVAVADLPSNLQYPTSERVPEKDELLPLEELERRAILRTLRQTSGDKLAAARILGIGKTTLYRKLKQYHMETAVS